MFRFALRYQQSVCLYEIVSMSCDNKKNLCILGHAYFSLIYSSFSYIVSNYVLYTFQYSLILFLLCKLRNHKWLFVVKFFVWFSSRFVLHGKYMSRFFYSIIRLLFTKNVAEAPIVHLRTHSRITLFIA